MSIKIDPSYVCSSCGYTDFMGEVNACPMCNPSMSESGDESCFFLRVDNNLCRRDNTVCPYHKNLQFDDCPKLE